MKDERAYLLHAIEAIDAILSEREIATAARKHAWTLVSVDMKDLVKPGLAAAPDDPNL